MTGGGRWGPRRPAAALAAAAARYISSLAPARHKAAAASRMKKRQRRNGTGERRDSLLPAPIGCTSAEIGSYCRWCPPPAPCAPSLSNPVETIETTRDWGGVGVGRMVRGEGGHPMDSKRSTPRRKRSPGAAVGPSLQTRGWVGGCLLGLPLVSLVEWG